MPTFVVEAGARRRVGVHPARRAATSARPRSSFGGQPRGRRRARRRRAADRRPLRAAPGPCSAAASRGRASSRSRSCSATTARRAAGAQRARRPPARARSSVAGHGPRRGRRRLRAQRSTSTAAGSRRRALRDRARLARRPAPRHPPRAVPARRAGARSGSTRARVADGTHTLVARVEDVAGNARTAAARDRRRQPAAARAARVGAGGRAASEALTAAAERVRRRGRHLRLPLGALRATASCAEIGGAVVADLRAPRRATPGSALRAVVAATDGGGTVRVASAPSGLVTGAGTRPVRRGSRRDASPAAASTAWLERGRRRLRRTTVTWPTRVRIRGRLTDLAGRPLARTPVRMLERIDGRRWRADHRRPHAPRRPPDDVHRDRPVAAGPARLRRRVGHAAARASGRRSASASAAAAG